MNTALQSHLIPLDLPADKWGAYYDSHLVIVDAIKADLSAKVFNSIWGYERGRVRYASNLRLPINPRLECPSQAVAPTLTSGVST